MQEMAHWKTAHFVPATPHVCSSKVGYFFSPSMPHHFSFACTTIILNGLRLAVHIISCFEIALLIDTNLPCPSCTSSLSSDQTQPLCFTPYSFPPLSSSKPILIKLGVPPRQLIPMQIPTCKKKKKMTTIIWMCTSTHHMSIKTSFPLVDSPTFHALLPPLAVFPASLASATFVMAFLPENVALPPPSEVGLATTSVSVKGDLSRSHNACNGSVFFFLSNL